MMSAMKLAKRVKGPESGDCLDRISNLPDELLAQMLSLLPTKCAVSSSVLSKRWRYLFTLTDCLYFDDAPCLRKGYEQHMFRRFVYKVLELHQTSPIKVFSLICSEGKLVYGKSDLKAWVSTAIQKGVQEFHYQVLQHELLPASLFICETLVKLKIVFRWADYFGSMKIPLSACLPRLKILHLDYVKFPNHEAIERLFSSCELLEDLTLVVCSSDSYADGYALLSSGVLKILRVENCTFDDSSDHEGLFEIDAPNLAYLTYTSNSGVEIIPSWEDSCSLVNAELEFNYEKDVIDKDEFSENDDDDYYSSLEFDHELLEAAAYKVTSLRLESNAIELLLTRVDIEQMPDFPCLSRLQISAFPLDLWKYVTSLLDKSPNLETVVFEWGLHDVYCESVLPPNEALPPFSCNVQKIELLRFCGHEGSLKLLGHVLRNAPLLKSLIVHLCDGVKMDGQQRISKGLSYLSALPRASRDCCIELKEGELSMCSREYSYQVYLQGYSSDEWIRELQERDNSRLF